MRCNLDFFSGSSEQVFLEFTLKVKMDREGGEKNQRNKIKEENSRINFIFEKREESF